MSDVDGMFGRSERGELVVVVNFSGKLEKEEFEELVAAVKEVARKHPNLKIEVKKV